MWSFVVQMQKYAKYYKKSYRMHVQNQYYPVNIQLILRTITCDNNITNACKPHFKSDRNNDLNKM